MKHSEKPSDCAALCSLLVAALSPAGIYKVEYRLPGAAGAPLRCSLIVLLPNGAPKAISGYEPVLQLTRLSTAPEHCSIHHVHTVTEWIARGHPFFCRHIVAQNLVYSDGSCRLPEADPAVLPGLAEGLRQRFAQQLGRACGFFRCAGVLRASGRRDAPLAAFMLHQSVELGYRGLLEALNGHCKKTHELRQLRDQCLRCAPELSALFPDHPGPEGRLLDILEAGYSGARYDSGFVADAGDLDELTERVGAFLAAAACVFREELDR